MDYEKKYKEALRWAKQVIDGKRGFVISEVKEIFPELKESEDERIRKELINAIKGDIMLRSSKEKELAIAWLEKQKPAEQSEEYNPYKATVESILEMFQKDHDDNRDFISNIAIKCQDAVEYDTGKRPKIQEQKPVEWSKEDEEMLEACIALCDDKIRFTAFKDVRGYTEKSKAWLKSLKQKIGVK